jgi:adenylylsulfate reductase subunit A
MTTVPGLFAAGDASGASSHKFSSGSFTEGRIAAKEAIRFCTDHDLPAKMDEEEIRRLREVILKPLVIYQENKNYTIDPEVNPRYLKPKSFMFRLQKIMDEYAGGVNAQFRTSEAMLKRGLEHLAMLKEDAGSLAAENLHELMRCWENIHRLAQAEAHIRAMLYRQETRWPGYYFRTDFPEMKKDWHCFVNCRQDPATGEWEMIRREVIDMV